MKWLKQLFCNHKWVEKIGMVYDLLVGGAYKASMKECSKCGKIKEDL